MSVEELSATTVSPTSVDDETKWRITVRDHLADANPKGLIRPKTLHDLGVFYGGRGVWFNAARTRSLDARGITVGVLHTGLHYADDLTDDGVIYHYPRTGTPGRDEAEILATKSAGENKVPVFVVSHPKRNSNFRKIQLGWVTGWKDVGGIFFIQFTEEPPNTLLDQDRSDDEPFSMFGNRRRRVDRTVTERPDQTAFKFKVFQRYGIECPLSGVTVQGMLEAAHIVPYSKNGSDNARNGLPLNAALHRAFDANLFAIHPDTYEVHVRPDGPTLGALGIITPTLANLHKRPDREVLAWRFEEWRKSFT